MSKLKTLRAKQQHILADAKEALNQLTPEISPDRENELQARHDELMAEYDDLDFQARLIERDEAIDTSRRPGSGNRTARTDSEERLFSLKPEERCEDWQRERVGRSEFADLSLGNYLRSMVTGAKTDQEKRALSEGTDSQGGFTVPDLLSSRLIDLMRNRMALSRAGAMTVPLGSDTNHIATVASDPVPAWRAEHGAVAESDPTFSRVELLPKSLAVLVKASREVLDDTLNIGTALPNIIASALAVEVDRVGLFGTGVDPEPQGVANISGIGEVDHLGAALDYTPLLTARGQITGANFSGDDIGFIMNPAEENTLAGLKDSQGQWLGAPPVMSRAQFFSTGNVPDADAVSPTEGIMLAGVWKHLLVGIRQEIRIETLKERFADTLEVGFLAHLRVDFAVEYPSAFVAIRNIADPD